MVFIAATTILLLNLFGQSANPILSVAQDQIGLSDSDNGFQPEGRYGGKGHNWCSEFVSWVYLKAGSPMIDAENPQGLQNDTGKIIRWFKANGSYLTPEDAGWFSYQPQPGDYVYIGRADSKGGLTDRKHSGIVEFVSPDGALHTIEGNNHGRPVSRFVYPYFKTNRKENGSANGIILGIGHR